MLIMIYQVFIVSVAWNEHSTFEMEGSLLPSGLLLIQYSSLEVLFKSIDGNFEM